MNSPRLELGDQQTHARPSPACRPEGGRRGRGNEDDGRLMFPGLKAGAIHDTRDHNVKS